MNLKFNIEPQNAPLPKGQGRPEQRPEDVYMEVPSPDEEERLNFKVVELWEDAKKYMNVDGSDKAPRWGSIRKLMKRMRDAFPYLINDDTNLMLSHEKKIGSKSIKVEGPLTYSLFMDAVVSDTTMVKYHEHIVNKYGTIGEGDHQRESLWAEDVLQMLYSTLKYELKRHNDDMDIQDYDDEAKEEPAENVVRMPHFGMENSERAQQRWEAAYEWLADRKWLWRGEVDYHEWVYACCGQQKAHEGPIVWHGTKAALAYIIRTKFNGQWDIATKIFCLANGKTFTKTFWNTNGPVPNVAKSIDRAFSDR